MPTFVYDILSSPLFYGFLLFWLIVDIAAEKRRQEVFNLVEKLIHKPQVFEKDTEPINVPFYARNLLEAFANWFYEALQEPLKGLKGLLQSWLTGLIKIITKPTKPLLVVGYILSFILLLTYLYLDTIGVVTALVSRGFVSPDFPQVFQKYEYLAIGGSLFALLVAGYILAQMTKRVSELSDWDGVVGLWRSLARIAVYILIASGLFAVVFLSLELMISLGYFENESDIVLGLVDFASTVLTRVNVALASILLFEDGIKGFVVVAIVVIAILLGVSFLLDYIAAPIGKIIPYFLDIVYRIILLVVFIVWFLVTTPILLFTSLFKGIASSDSDG
jgi:hypothetical protein